MNRRDFIAAAGSGLLGLPAWPQSDYPRAGATLRYVVPFPPGGLTDVMARLVGQQLGSRWGLNAVIDNKPGNGGQIGADAVAKAPGDGYNLLAITLTHAANVTLFKGRAPYDFQRDLKPVALLAGSPMLVVVPAASPIKDFKDLTVQARARKLRALAIASTARHPLVPEVPTTAEAGLAGLAVENWTAIMVPMATPDTIVAKLGAEVVAIMAGADINERARTQGFRVDARGPREFAAFVKDEVERWGRLITSAGITAS